MKTNEVFLPEFDSDSDVSAVAAKILPLPSTVTPSAQFLRQTRLRLSRLVSEKNRDSRQAA